jgi:hypothetical protein
MSETLRFVMDSEFYRWLFEAVAGLILIGFGLSLFGQSVIYKSKGEKVTKWFLWGTLSLIVINAGICILADSVKQRIYYEKITILSGSEQVSLQINLKAGEVFVTAQYTD